MAPFTSLEDSPMLRRKLGDMEKEVDGIKERCKLLTKASKKYRDGLMSMHLSEKEFASALEEVCTDNDADHVAMGPFVTVLNQLASFHHTLYTQMDELLFEPLHRWQSDLADVKELRKKLDKCGEGYDEHRSRYLGMRKKTKQEVLDKQAAELQNARREFDEARYQMAHKLIAVECRKEYEFLEAMASSMEAHMHFFRRGLDLFAGLEPKILNALQVAELHRSKEKQEEVELSAMVTAQRDAAAAMVAASTMAESPFSAPNGGAGPLQLTSSAARRVVEIEQLVRDSLDAGSNSISVIKQGYLFKRSSNMRADWKRRFFILDSRGALCYYRNKDANSATHTVNLLFSTIKPDADDASVRCCFRVVSPNKTYTLQAENEVEVMQWTESLQAVIAFLINNTTPEQLQALLPDNQATPQGPRGHRRNNSADSDISVQSDGEFAVVERVPPLSGARWGSDRSNLSIPDGIQDISAAAGVDSREGSPINSMDSKHCPPGCFNFRRPNPYAQATPGANSKDAPIQYVSTLTNRPDSPSQLRSQDAYEVIRKVDGNQECADCGAADPDWASLTFGITLCIECSGIHRQMGVHISKVRSLTLDVRVWEPSVMQLFGSLGNRFMNSLLEENGSAVQGTTTTDDSWLWSAESDTEESEVDRSTLGPGASLAASSASSVLPLANLEEPVKKPMPGDGLAVKDKYITAKYIEKRFRAASVTSKEQLQADLWTAVDIGDIKAAMRCLVQGADVNHWYSHNGAVQLMCAALEVAKELQIPIPPLSASSSSSGHLELTLLHLAARDGQISMIELLLQAGAAIGAEDMYRRGPLHYCMLFQTTSTAKLLLRKGAKANSTDLSNCTPLETAMRRGRVTDEELFVMLSDAVDKDSERARRL